jgi:hypothetical protein
LLQSNSVGLRDDFNQSAGALSLSSGVGDSLFKLRLELVDSCLVLSDNSLFIVSVVLVQLNNSVLSSLDVVSDSDGNSASVGSHLSLDFSYSFSLLDDQSVLETSGLLEESSLGNSLFF